MFLLPQEGGGAGSAGAAIRRRPFLGADVSSSKPTDRSVNASSLAAPRLLQEGGGRGFRKWWRTRGRLVAGDEDQMRDDFSEGVLARAPFQHADDLRRCASRVLHGGFLLKVETVPPLRHAHDVRGGTSGRLEAMPAERYTTAAGVHSL